MHLIAAFPVSCCSVVYDEARGIEAYFCHTWMVGKQMNRNGFFSSFFPTQDDSRNQPICPGSFINDRNTESDSSSIDKRNDFLSFHNMTVSLVCSPCILLNGDNISFYNRLKLILHVLVHTGMLL